MTAPKPQEDPIGQLLNRTDVDPVELLRTVVVCDTGPRRLAGGLPARGAFTLPGSIAIIPEGPSREDEPSVRWTDEQMCAKHTRMIAISKQIARQPKARDKELAAIDPDWVPEKQAEMRTKAIRAVHEAAAGLAWEAAALSREAAAQGPLFSRDAELFRAGLNAPHDLREMVRGASPATLRRLAAEVRTAPPAEVGSEPWWRRVALCGLLQCVLLDRGPDLPLEVRKDLDAAVKAAPLDTPERRSRQRMLQQIREAGAWAPLAADQVTSGITDPRLRLTADRLRDRPVVPSD